MEVTWTLVVHSQWWHAFEYRLFILRSLQEDGAGGPGSIGKWIKGPLEIRLCLWTLKELEHYVIQAEYLADSAFSGAFKNSLGGFTAWLTTSRYSFYDDIFSSFFLPFSFLFLLGGEGRFVGMENDEWDWASRSGRHKNKQTKRKLKKKNPLFGRVVQKILWHTSCQRPFSAVFLQIPTFQVRCPTSNQTLHCIVSSWELT